MTKLNPSFSRRNLLLGTLQGAGFFLLSGCEKVFDSLSRNDKVQSLLELAEHGSRRAQAFARRPQQARPGIQRQRYIAKISQQRQPATDHHGLRGRRKKTSGQSGA